jgi:hypothetical protein
LEGIQEKNIFNLFVIILLICKDNQQNYSIAIACMFQEGHLTSLADFRQFGAEMARVSSYALKDSPVIRDCHLLMNNFQLGE